MPEIINVYNAVVTHQNVIFINSKFPISQRYRTSRSCMHPWRTRVPANSCCQRQRFLP